MKASQVKCQVKRTGDPVQFCGIRGLHLCLNACVFQLSLCQGNGPRREINARHLPAGPGQRDNVRTRSAANIDGASGFMGFDEFEEFRGTDSCIPGWLPEIPVMKKQPTEYVLQDSLIYTTLYVIE